MHVVCVEHDRCINWTAEAKKFVNPEICINVLCLVGFRVVDSAATPADTKLEVNLVDNRGDDGWLTMDEFKLCHGILEQNRKSIGDALNVTNSIFCGCVSRLCRMF